MKKTVPVIFSLFFISLLTSCAGYSPLELLYYNRVKFTYNSDELDDSTTFLCTEEGSTTATREKADRAYEIFELQLLKVVD